MKHALAEKRSAEADAVQPADQIVSVINFDRVAIAALVELAIKLSDPLVDPGARAPRLRLSAAIDHRLEVPINKDAEWGGTHRSR